MTNKSPRITDVALNHTFSDDRILCAHVTLTREDGTTETRDLLWCGWEVLAAVTYWGDSNKAKDVLQDWVWDDEKEED